MGTRSDIIVKRSDNMWKRIYCHWDGYLSHNGQILFDHYNSQEKAEALVALGDLSSLAEEIGTKHNFDWRSEPKFDRSKKMSQKTKQEYNKLSRQCNAYGRDRGETECDGYTGDSLSAVWPEKGTWTEFTYIWYDGNWYVADPDEGSQAAILLKDALAQNVKGANPIKSYVKAPWGVLAKRT